MSAIFSELVILICFPQQKRFVEWASDVCANGGQSAILFSPGETKQRKGKEGKKKREESQSERPNVDSWILGRHNNSLCGVTSIGKEHNNCGYVRFVTKKAMTSHSHSLSCFSQSLRTH
jgi:hypothetical protein